MVGGIIGLLSVGIFSHKEPLLDNMDGLLHGGGFHSLGVQSLAVVSVVGWSTLWGVVLFYVLHVTIGLRVSAEVETMGLDAVEHNLIEVHIEEEEELTKDDVMTPRLTPRMPRLASKPSAQQVSPNPHVNDPSWQQ